MEELSLCMIVRNEELFLERCLESVRLLVDEIIIVDTGSSDKTKEIAEKYADYFFEYIWDDDFSKARNFAISKASGKWILSLDADETISKEDVEKVKRILENPSVDGFYFILRDYKNDSSASGFISSMDDKYVESKESIGYTESIVLRLFKNKYRFNDKIHETVLGSIKSDNGKILKTDIVIHHFGTLKRLKAEMDEKKDKYINLMKKSLEEDSSGKPFYIVYYNIARSALMKRDYKLAEEYLWRSLKENPIFFNSLIQLGAVYLLQDNLIESEKLLRKAVELNGDNPDVHENLGILYAKKGEFNKATRKFDRALELNDKSASCYFNYALVCLQMGKKNKAIDLFEKAIELDKNYAARKEYLSLMNK